MKYRFSKAKRLSPSFIAIRRQCDRGATLVEFAIVTPILFILILALFDFVRFLTIRGILNSAAHRAVSLASVIDGLDTDCLALPEGGTLQAECRDRRLAAVEQVLQVARALPTGTMVSAHPSIGNSAFLIAGTEDQPAIELVLNPGVVHAYLTDAKEGTSVKYNYDDYDTRFNPPGDTPLREVLQGTPIEIAIQGRVRPYLWFLGPLEVRGFAAGYREPRFLTSFPAMVNCWGGTLGTGRRGHF